MLVYRGGTPSMKFAGTNLYTWVEKGTVRLKVSCLETQHGVLKPLDPDTSALTMKLPLPTELTLMWTTDIFLWNERKYTYRYVDINKEINTPFLFLFSEHKWSQTFVSEAFVWSGHFREHHYRFSHFTSLCSGSRYRRTHGPAILHCQW